MNHKSLGQVYWIFLTSPMSEFLQRILTGSLSGRDLRAPEGFFKGVGWKTSTSTHHWGGPAHSLFTHLRFLEWAHSFTDSWTTVKQSISFNDTKLRTKPWKTTKISSLPEFVESKQSLTCHKEPLVYTEGLLSTLPSVSGPNSGPGHSCSLSPDLPTHESWCHQQPETYHLNPQGTKVTSAIFGGILAARVNNWDRYPWRNALSKWGKNIKWEDTVLWEYVKSPPSLY